MRRRTALLGATTLLLALALATTAPAAIGPLYDVRATWGPTFLKPGDTKVDTAEGQFAIQVRNVGDAAGAEEEMKITEQLPAGVTASAIHWPDAQIPASACQGVGTGKVTCTLPAAMVPDEAKPPSLVAGGSNPYSPNPTGYMTPIFIDVSVPANKVPGSVGTSTATVEGGGAPSPVQDIGQVRFDNVPSPFGVVEGSFAADNFTAAFPFGEPARLASDRPFELRVDFDLTATSGVNDQPGGDGTRYIASNGQLRKVEVTLPRGMIGNPEAVPKCEPILFSEAGALSNGTACPPETQVGYLNVFVNHGNANYGGGTNSGGGGGWVLANRVPLYNLVPPKGVLADLAFNAAVVQGHIYPTLDPARGYAIKTVTPNISSIAQVRGSEVTTWGVPADPAHDRFRWYSAKQEGGTVLGAPWGSAPIRPFLTNPMDCGFDNGGATMRLDSYEHPGNFSPTVEYDDHLNVTGCDNPRFRFEPEVELDPSSRDAGGPTGLDVNLKVPQRNDEVEDATDLYAANGKVKAFATPPFKKVVVTLPEGMTVSPSAAPGLEACSMDQVGIAPDGTPNDEPDRCPDAAQYGTIRLKSPALPQDKVITGRLYVATPYENPFGSFLALYFVIDDEDLGLRVKLPGEVSLDPVTGQITTTFDDLPQLPVSESEVKVKGGLRAGLVNPQTCGTKTIEATFYPWHDRDTPYTVKDSYEITQGPGGTPCFNTLAERPFEPDFLAGTTNPLAGAFAPMEIDFSREDTDQELSEAQGTAPQGLIASLRGIGRCPDAAIAAAANPARTGNEEIDSPSCPADSQVGTVDAGAGVGEVLAWTSGKVYLAGPYKGAPASGVAIVPAAVGPFDLGVVVTRAPAYLDPVTAQLKIKTDPLPLIFKGVPVRVRDVRVHLDRQNFTLNPTSCEEMEIEATLHSSEGKSKDASNRFQVGDCAALGFKPRLALSLAGGVKRGAHPSFRALFRPRPGDANTARIQVKLPRSAFLDQAHIRTICTRVQFAAGQGHGSQCPAGSIYGHVTAYTPLLDEPLSGPVYLRSSSHNLPDLVAAVSGPPSLPIHFESAARIDSVKGGIRSTFTFFPDVPLEEAVLSMRGGRKGLIVNSRDLCAKPSRALAGLRAHNGRFSRTRPEVVAANCKKKPRKAKRSRAGHSRRGQGLKKR